MKRTAAGFTLIEVMIAITIMGVLALICWRALDSVASSDQRLRRADAETTTALRVLQQFQRDIEMRADDALMNGAVRPADRPQRLLPPSLVSERHPDGSFALEITRSVDSDGLRWQRVRWWRQGNTLWRASGAATDRYPLPAPDPSRALRWRAMYNGSRCGRGSLERDGPCCRAKARYCRPPDLNCGWACAMGVGR